MDTGQVPDPVQTGFLYQPLEPITDNILITNQAYSQDIAFFGDNLWKNCGRGRNNLKSRSAGEVYRVCALNLGELNRIQIFAPVKAGPQIRRKTMDDQTRIELEAAAFRGLVAHLQKRTDAQNIDIMNMAGFCRNCLSKWYMAAAKDRGIEMDYEEAREAVYGMPYDEWKDKHQEPASDEQKAKFEETKPLHAQISGH